MRVSSRLIVFRVLCVLGLVALMATLAHAQDTFTTTSHGTHRHKAGVAQAGSRATLYAVQRRKIEFHLPSVHVDGSRGREANRVNIAYEFSIPDNKRYRAEVRHIDATVQFMPGVSGHVRAKKGQCLCLGSTNQKHWRTVLYRLAALPYVERIIENVFE